MSKLLEQYRSVRIDAMKRKDSKVRYATEAVITEVETQAGRGVTVDDALVIDITKKEIKKYSEMKDGTFEIKVLETFLPKQMTTEEIVDFHNMILDKFGYEKVTPKYLMDALNDYGNQGKYDKGTAAKVAMGKL